MRAGRSFLLGALGPVGLLVGLGVARRGRSRTPRSSRATRRTRARNCWAARQRSRGLVAGGLIGAFGIAALAASAFSPWLVVGGLKVEAAFAPADVGFLTAFLIGCGAVCLAGLPCGVKGFRWAALAPLTVGAWLGTWALLAAELDAAAQDVLETYEVVGRVDAELGRGSGVWWAIVSSVLLMLCGVVTAWPAGRPLSSEPVGGVLDDARGYKERRPELIRPHVVDQPLPPPEVVERPGTAPPSDPGRSPASTMLSASCHHGDPVQPEKIDVPSSDPPAPPARTSIWGNVARSED